MHACRRSIAVIAFACATVFAADHAKKEGVSPDAALRLLNDGNIRFAAGKSLYERQDQERRALTASMGQHPYASILSCADSRVPLEFIFDAGIGDIFVVRVAGNVADVDEIGTIEYGVGHLGTPLLVVLGHTKCGAVTAVVKKDHVGGSIPLLVDNIVPAVKRAEAVHPPLSGDRLVHRAMLENVNQALEDILTRSEEVRMLVREKKLMAVGAYYNLETGEVRFLGRHPDEVQLLKQSGKPAGGHGKGAGH